MTDAEIDVDMPEAPMPNVQPEDPLPQNEGVDLQAYRPQGEDEMPEEAFKPETAGYLRRFEKQFPQY